MRFKLPKLRIKMLSWLGMPVLLVVLLTTQLFKTMDSFISNYIAKANAVSASEQDLVTKLPPIADFNYQNTGLVTIWFDDAWKSHYDIGFPTLEKYGFKAALAVPTKVVGSYNYMDWLQVKRVQHAGWEINAHSRTHNCEMENAGPTLITSEVLGSMQDLKSLGLRADIYVTPCGVENPLIEEAVKKNYPTGLRTSNPGMNRLPVPDKYDIVVMAVRNTTTKKEVQGWLAQAKREKKWIILMFHRIDNAAQEFDTSKVLFEEIILAVQESQLPVLLPTQVLRLPGTNNGIDTTPSINQPINEPSVKPLFIKPTPIVVEKESEREDKSDDDTKSPTGGSKTTEELPKPTAEPEVPRPSVIPSVEPSLTPTLQPTSTPVPSNKPPILPELPILSPN